MDVIALALAKKYVERTRYKRRIAVETPADFSWKNHPLQGKIFTDGFGQFWVEGFDVASLAPTGKTYYVDPSNVTGNANDSNTGLTPNDPLERPSVAIAKPDVDVIEVMSSAVRNRTFQAQSAFTRNLTIRAYEGRDIIIGGHENTSSFTWSKTSGRTNVYQSSYGSTVYRVFDSGVLDAEGDYTELIKKTSLDDVDANPASWYQADGVLYVHMPDSRPADNLLRVYVNVALLRLDFTADATLYVEGIKFYGGRTFDVRNTDTGAPNVYVKNCEFKYALDTVDGGFVTKGARNVIVQNCIASKNINDGFNYHDSGGAIGTKIIEIDCIGRDNGLESETDNGSTLHDGIKGIRINGAYYRNIGPNVADVGEGTESWNMACVAFESRANIADSNNDFSVSSGPAKLFLDSCIGYGSKNSLNVKDAVSTAYVRNNRFATESVTGIKVDY